MEAYVFYDDAEFQHLAKMLRSSPDIFRAACKSAIGRAGRGMRGNVRKGIRRESYLKGGEVSSAIGRLKFAEGGLEAGLLVRSRKLPAHSFKLVPKKITARKGAPSRKWKEPQFQISPKLQPAYAERNGASKGFIFRGKSSGELVLGQRGLNKKGDKKSIRTVYGVAAQYFAVFDEVKEPVLDEAAKTFMKRLVHEIDYRLGLGK